jgi:hypothetical protein
MKRSDFLSMMGNLEPPNFEDMSYQNHFRTYLLKTRPNAAFGFLLILLPLLFVTANILEYVLKVNPGPLRLINDLFVFFDQEPLLWWLGPAILLGGPLLAFLLNLLSVLHIHYEKPSRELVIALRLQWLNIAVLVFCFLIVGLLVLYLLLENAGQ